MRRFARVTWLLLTVLAAAYLFAFKRGWIAPRPAVFAMLVCFAAAAALAVVAVAILEGARGPRRVPAMAEALAASGVVLVATGGLANWALGFQGVVLVMEREPVRLSRAQDLVDFDAGPMASRRELDVSLALARLDLRPAGRDGFRAVSRIRVLDPKGEEIEVPVVTGRPARLGPLFLRQGAFGFAPRVVVMKEGRMLLDTHVPFRTVREGSSGVSFLGEFEIAAEKLALHGAITLDDLNDDMKGHPRLELSVEHDGRLLGAGKLRPGEFTALEEGYRIAFAGLRRWSELDFARRTYPVPMLAGAVLLAAGALLWPIATWRRW
jgi:hypothetical protein